MSSRGPESAELIIATSEPADAHATLQTLSSAAWEAYHRRDWPAALEAWTRYTALSQADPVGPNGLGCVYREMELYEKADAAFDEGLRLFPDDFALLSNRASVAQRQGHWDEALSRWARVKDQYPDHPASYFGPGSTLRMARLFDEADTVLAEGAARFPEHADILFNYAAAASDRHAYDLALDRWGQVRSAFTNEPWGYEGMAASLLALERHDEAEIFIGASLEHLSRNRDILSKWCQLAEERGDYADAASRWHFFSRTFHEDAAGYLREARAWIANGDISKAEDILLSGRAQTSDLALCILYAQLGKNTGRWPEVTARWRDAIDRAGHEPAVYAEAIRAHLALENETIPALETLDIAVSLLDEATGRFPDDLSLLELRAILAERRCDWQDALIAWQRVCESFPERSSAFYGAASACRALGRFEDADLRLAESLERFPDNPDLLHLYAVNAGDMDLHTEAIGRWEACKSKFPDQPWPNLGIVRALRALGRQQDAEAFFQPIARIFPDDESVQATWAECASYREDTSELARRLRQYRTRFPPKKQTFLAEAHAWLASGQLKEAETTLDEAMERFSGDFDIASLHAHVRERSRDWPAAIACWRNLCDRFDIDEAYAGLGRSYLLMGDASTVADCADVYRAAADILDPAVLRFPDNRELLRLHAGVAWKLKNFDEACRRWSSFVKRFPDDIGGLIGFATFYRENGDYSAAERTLEQASERVPDNVDVEYERAVTASLRRDWPVALKRWLHLKETFSLSPVILQSLDIYVAQAQLDRVVTPNAFEIPPALLDGQQGHSKSVDDMKALFMGFESLGDDCEFGIVQRRFGAEPLGLLRWTMISCEMLTKALWDRFERLNHSENVRLEVVHGEYTTRVDAYNMFSHTFTRESDYPKERFYTQQCKRMVFLRDKLLQDMGTGEKIFVYKAYESLSEAQIHELHAAFACVGPAATLLCVKLQTADHPAGDVEDRGGGLLVGYIDRFSTTNISTDIWVKLCRTALQIKSSVLN